MLKGILRNFQLTASLTTSPTASPTTEQWNAAGCSFTNGIHILAGYQAKKKKQSISGIGGRREKGESVIQTAFREMIEELLELPTFPQQIIRDLETNFTPLAQIQSGPYIELVFTFETLEAMLSIIQTYNIQSPLYIVFPTTIADLVLERQIKDSVELSHLVLLPLLRGVRIEKCFLESIDTIKSLVEENPTE